MGQFLICQIVIKIYYFIYLFVKEKNLTAWEMMITIIHETEIKQFGNRNGRNRVEIISTLGHKSRIVETDYEGRNELRGSKRITKVETNYEGRNELQRSKWITL